MKDRFARAAFSVPGDDMGDVLQILDHRPNGNAELSGGAGAAVAEHDHVAPLPLRMRPHEDRGRLPMRADGVAQLGVILRVVVEFGRRRRSDPARRGRDRRSSRPPASSWRFRPFRRSTASSSATRRAAHNRGARPRRLWRVGSGDPREEILRATSASLPLRQFFAHKGDFSLLHGCQDAAHLRPGLVKESGDFLVDRVQRLQRAVIGGGVNWARSTSRASDW